MNYEELLVYIVFFPMIYGACMFSVRHQGLLWGLSLLGSSGMVLGSLVLLEQGEGMTAWAPFFTHLGMGLETTSFSLLYGVLTSFMWLVAVIACKDYFSSHEKGMGLFYGSLFIVLGATLGVFFAQDLLTLFVFFEIMSFTSYLWVIHTREKSAIAAGNLYLAFGVVGGLSLLLGIFMLSPHSVNLPISELKTLFEDPERSASAVVACRFLFYGFGAKAGAFFLYDWLPPSYEAAPAPATALLSSILSKCGVYGLLLVTLRIMYLDKGFTVLILLIGLLGMVMGGGCGLFSGNLKRTLGYSSISQVGFMLWGLALTNLLGSHNTYAGYGTMYHMINHSLIKMSLFCLAGMVYTHGKTLELSQLQGFGKKKPVFQALFTVSALSLTGVPLFAGYVSKTLLHESMVEYIHYFSDSWFFHFYEWMFLLSGGFTTAYMLKLYFCLFVDGDEAKWSHTKSYASLLQLGSLTLVAVVLLVCGLSPNGVYGIVGQYTADFMGVHPYEHIDYFVWENLKGSLISLSIGGFLFWVNRAWSRAENQCEYRERVSEKDTFVEKFYKPVIWILALVMGVFARLFDIASELLVYLSCRSSFKKEEIPDTFFHGEDNMVKKKAMNVHISRSLAYSLLMFGLGLIFTIVYLLVVGGTVNIDLLLGTKTT